jgi:peptidoglycan/xylan/chitin deacetylase (PgdA/CDA1 family)
MGSFYLISFASKVYPRMKLVFFVILLTSTTVTFGQKKKVCFSMDDLPLVTYGISDSSYQQSLTDKIITSLNRNNIPAIGFVNEIKLYDKNGTLIPWQIKLLEQWIDGGLELGNHTYSHPDYHTLSFEAFSREVLKGEVITKEILSRKGLSLTYFRHPFLHTGNSKEKSDSLNIFLSDHGYTIAPVTIDNEDYLFALAYKRAKDKEDITLMKKIGSDYLDYMESKLKYFERQADLLFGRQINQILLLHANLLNADYLDSLAKIFLRNSYEFVTMKEALEDSAYKTRITVYGKWGISWIDRWALSQGKKGDFFKGDPMTPDYIKKLSE